MKKSLFINLRLTRIALLSVFSMVLLGSCTTTYYVVRHAEKRNNSDTSTLTDAGSRRALALKDLLADQRITSAYATIYPRTQLTAKPLADANNLMIRLYRPDTTLQFANRLDRVHGSRLLVVGHSNNVGIIVKRLSGKTIAPISESDFDNFYKVKKVRNLFRTTRSLTQSTYGTP
jgi:phosphohistidine phosphatase SixA